MSEQLDLDYKIVPELQRYSKSTKEIVSDPDFVEAFIPLYKTGISMKSICRTLGIPAHKMYHLFSEFDNGGNLSEEEIAFVSAITSARTFELEAPIVRAFNAESLNDYKAAIKRLALICDDYIERKVVESTNNNINADYANLADMHEDDVEAELNNILSKINGK